MFREEWLRETARETGLVKRERKIDPTIMFWVYLLASPYAFFISRIRKNTDPEIVSIEEGVPETKRKVLFGKIANECKEQISVKDIDAIVKIALKRRAYKGKQKNDEMKVRLIAVYNEEKEKYHIYITNIKQMLLIF